MRTVALLVAAVGVLVEAAVLGRLLFALSEVAGRLSLSVDGHAIGGSPTGIRTAAVLLAGAFAAIAVGLVLAAVRRRALGRPTRVLIVFALVVQWFLAILAALALGWQILAAVLGVFGALLYALLAEPPPNRPRRVRWRTRPRRQAPSPPPQSTPSAA